MKRLAICGALVSGSAFAYQAGVPAAPNITISDPSSLTSIYESMVGQWLNVVSPYATEVFWALAFLDISWFGVNLLMHYGGDISRAMLAVTNKILIISMFLVLLLNGSTWMAMITNGFIQIGKEASGVPSLAPSVILQQGFIVFGSMLWQAVKTGFLFDFPTAVALIFAAALICFAFLAITVLFIVAKVNVFLALGIGFVFLGFGGSRWTAPYVERYFAFCVTSGLKLMALYLLIGAGQRISQTWIMQAQGIGPAMVTRSWAIMCGALIYACICWFCTQLISSVLGGAPTLSHGDFMAFMGPMISTAVAGGMIAAGLATGGASAGAAAAGAGAKGAAGSAGAVTGGGATGASSPPSSNGHGGSAVGAAVRSAAMAGAQAARSMPHGGHVGQGPRFNGFSHD